MRPGWGTGGRRHRNPPRTARCAGRDSRSSVRWGRPSDWRFYRALCNLSISAGLVFAERHVMRYM